MNRIAVAPLVACLVGCTPPTSEPPDALELTKLTVDELRATNAEAGFVGAEEASVTSLLASSAEVSALTSTRVTADELVIKQGDSYRRLYGAPVGAAAVVFQELQGYRDANARCASAFPAGEGEPLAHVCNKDEIAFALEAGTVFPDGMEGAAFNVFVPLGPFPSDDELDPTPTMVDDCNAWRSAQTTVYPANRAALVLGFGQTTSGEQLPHPVLQRSCPDVERLACCR